MIAPVTFGDTPNAILARSIRDYGPPPVSILKEWLAHGEREGWPEDDLRELADIIEDQEPGE